MGNHLTCPADIDGFPVFPAGTKSALSRHLTRAHWDKYCNIPGYNGYGFREAIFSGCKNLDSGIGVYAGGVESYAEFEDFYDEIILDYHGHAKTANHPDELSGLEELNAPPFPADEAAMIKSTRIRVGRNLAGFPLGPAISTQQRQQVQSKAQEAFSNFQGELAGTYYQLTSLSDAERKQLIEDHFLFKEGDRFLEACGLNRDWPDSRGIFHNKDKTFLSWVNEEDHLRIISMQPGADIGAVFARLKAAIAQIEKVTEFQYTQHLGFITSCPTNLGTALRASVHIHLPCLAMNKPIFEGIAKQYHVQIRGAHGEHTETNDGIFDISNIRRLGRSMTMLVQDMYDGVKAMIKKEKELAAAMGGS